MDQDEPQRPEGFPADEWARLCRSQQEEVIRIIHDPEVRASLEAFAASAQHFAETGEGPWVREL